jgi:hypothetical protein
VGRHIYEIRIEGHLGQSWTSWFEGMIICHEQGGQTVLTGPLPDEPALHGVLDKIRDLGLPLVEVRRSAAETAATDAKEEGAT